MTSAEPSPGLGTAAAAAADVSVVVSSATAAAAAQVGGPCAVPNHELTHSAQFLKKSWSK